MSIVLNSGVCPLVSGLTAFYTHFTLRSLGVRQSENVLDEMSCVCIKETTISLRSGPNREHRRHELRDLLLSERVVLDTARSWKSALLHGSPEHTRLPVRFDSLGVRLPPRAHGLALLFDVSVWHLSLSVCMSCRSEKRGGERKSPCRPR